MLIFFDIFPADQPGHMSKNISRFFSPRPLGLFLSSSTLLLTFLPWAPSSSSSVIYPPFTGPFLPFVVTICLLSGLPTCLPSWSHPFSPCWISGLAFANVPTSRWARFGRRLRAGCLQPGRSDHRIVSRDDAGALGMSGSRANMVRRLRSGLGLVDGLA